MKKIRATVEYELEVPDNWQLACPTEDEQEHLLIDGKYYQPGMMWFEYQKDSAGNESWAGADDDIEDLIQDHVRIVDCSIKEIEKLSLEEN